VHTVRFNETLTDKHEKNLSPVHTHITHITIHTHTHTIHTHSTIHTHDTHTTEHQSGRVCVCSSHVTNPPLKPDRSITIPQPNQQMEVLTRVGSK